MSMLFKRIKDWAVSITSFRTGDVLPVDGPSGTAKIPYSDLAKEVIKDSANNTVATESDLVAGSTLPIMTANGPKALPGNTIAKANEQAALTTYAQNVAHSIAPEFDPTRTSDNSYKAGESVTYTDGKVYTFKVDHYGSWVDADVSEAPSASKKLDLLLITDSPEYLYAITDKEKRFLFGIKKDGSIDWGKGIPSIIQDEFNKKVSSSEGKSLIDEVFAGCVSVTDSPEYLYAITDKEKRFLFGIKKDGSIDWGKGIPQVITNFVKTLLFEKVDKQLGKGLIDSGIADSFAYQENPEYVSFVLDSLKRLLCAVNKSGQFEFFASAKFSGGIDWSKDNVTELSETLKKYGFTGGQGDWSDSTYLHINKPKCAIVNFKNISAMPTTKTQNLHGIIQFWDMKGNYFQKNVIMNAQGSSSLVHPKKNIAIDFANEDWSEDGAFDLKVGDWVAQDSFHLKASWGEFFRCVGTVCYDILDEMMKTRGISYDAPWKQALIDQPNYPTGKGLAYDSVSDLSLRLDTGAKNHPMGFPCVVFLNDEFYGIFAWSIKKQRKNYHQEKKNAKHIHLDGEISREYLFNGSVDWTKIEIRNPTGLKYKEPQTIGGVETYDYDHDHPAELSDSDSKSVQVKTSIIGLSGVIAQLKNAVTTYGIDSQELKDLYETFFNVDNIIDYVVFSDIIGNTDGWRTNWQWVTYDGTKWWVCPYDLDRSFGTGLGYPVDSITGHMMVVDTLPHYYVIMNSDYNARLEQRYKELRDKGIFSVDNFMAKMNEFIQAVGFDFYEKEFSPEHWADSPNNSEMQVDTEHWELVLIDGEPVFGDSSTYSADTNYQVGDTCFYGPSKCYGYYKFECVSQTVGNRPIATLGFRDSIWRLRAWLDEHFEDMDTLYNYN